MGSVKIKPFEGAVTKFFEDEAPVQIRDALLSNSKGRILSNSFPYERRLKRSIYDSQMRTLQIELAKLQFWIRETGQRLVVVFEGRDAAGKGGVIKRVSANLNPRNAHIVALGTPTDKERGQWYFQRYTKHLPSRGDLALFDRSWYNRAVVESVFDFCSKEQLSHFFEQVPSFEKMIVDEGITLIKIWLNVSRTEQVRRFLSRETDPLKQWKLSNIDVEGLSKWQEYSKAIQSTFEKTDLTYARWTIVKSDDKRRAHIQVILNILSRFDYDGKDKSLFGEVDPLICGGPEIWSG